MTRITKQFHIGGMRCVNCQAKISKALREARGIEEAHVSYQTGKAKVVFDPDAISAEEIGKIIEALGYEILPEHRPNVSRLICLSAIIIALYVLLERFGVLNRLVPNRLANSGMGYGMLFATGLLTSVHCIAMCGGINLSQCLPGGDGRKPSFSAGLMYNAGRVFSYTVAGLLLGLLGMLMSGGSGSGPSALLQGVLKIVAGALMAIMGVNMLGLFPWLRKLNLKTPRFISGKIGKRRPSGPFFIGLLNGLMPCGPLQSMQILALASGSPLTGALSMLMFSLGTVPLMLGLGAIVTALGKRFARGVMNIGAVLVAVLGLAMLTQGGSLTGMIPSDSLLAIIIALFAAGVVASLPFSQKAHRVICAAAAFAIVIGASVAWQRFDGKPEEAASARVRDEVQYVESTLLPRQYPTITVEAGVPVEWTIHAPEGSLNGCNYSLYIPEYEIQYTFDEGENLIRFMPEESGEFAYSCWMGMIRGRIIVK